MFDTNNGGGCDPTAPGDPTAVGDPTLSLPVSRSRAATDTELLGLELTGLSTAELLQLQRDEESHLRRHAAIGHRLIAEFTSRGTGFEFGAKTTAGLLVQLLRINSYEAGQRVKAAELLGPQRTLTGEPLPPVFAATATTQASGAISVTHAAIITDTITALPDAIAAEHDLAVEQTLLQAAHQFTPTDLTHLAHAITARINPDGNKPDEHERTRRRGFTLGIGPDGTGYPSGRLTPECAAITRAWLDTLTAPAPADDGTPDPRTPAQRTHDALQTAGQQLLAADNTLPPSGGVPTTLLLTITANHHPDATDTTDTASTASTASTSSTGPDTASTGGPGTVLTLAPYATTTHGNLIPTATAMQLTDQADIITVHLNNHGGITSYGRSRRAASTSQRLALAARDRGCSFPGCTAPPGWTQAHHIRAWQHGGPTDLNNMTPVCGHHHRNYEKLGWTCHMQHGLPYWTPPAWIDHGSTTNRNPAATRHTTPNSDLEQLSPNTIPTEHNAASHNAAPHHPAAGHDPAYSCLVGP